MLIRRWAAGSEPIPAVVADWLEILAATHLANPVPEPDAWKQLAA
ncbi:hypothetical protein FHR90_003226 [Endobacter medicaginis]|uniref:Uncharacterized protein n=1 Tax=Endobacter medicaginis TaxID=1181271 RepID=A0A839V7G6_9PROT|nr:hypothetical protein [Endobacter medicaginis]MBB3175371.1 hypothetical protein [Endobacter medicaginis]MCX5476902.1 hypothetical protein [Endobacter medicaginis]